MGNDWLDDAVNSATGNLPTFGEWKQEMFAMFQKYRDLGFPDGIIVGMMCDSTKMPMTIPAMYDLWLSEGK